jgi:hypothetical protein
MFRMRLVARWAVAMMSGAAASALALEARAAVAPVPDMSQDAYKCIVLGQGDKCPREADSPSYGIKVVREVGPLAARMVREGVQVDAAVARARMLGETPRLRIVRIVSHDSGSITQREMREEIDPRLSGDEQTLVTIDEP